MAPHRPQPPRPENVLPIVVGAHLRAEVEDRPIGVALRDALAAKGRGLLTPVVVTDLWYLNCDSLRSQPAVSVGHPDVNALSAFLADKLPSVLAVDGRLIIQMDPELLEPVACCWGTDAPGTAEAVGVFLERWGDAFLDAAARATVGKRP